MRPKGPGRYDQFNLPANNRIENPLKQTIKDHSLPAQPDATPIALAIMRRARDLGLGPKEALRRHLDEEAARVAHRLAELEKPSTPLPPGEYACAVQDVVKQDIGRGAGGLNVKMALVDKDAHTVTMHLPKAKFSIQFEPEYEAYCIHPFGANIRVYAFQSRAIAERSATHRTLWELEADAGKLIAVVGSMESARAVLPKSARWELSAEHCELWVC
jgi:hypothetical protein